MIERMETYRALIQENIDYECFLDRREKEDVDELIELMVEILMMRMTAWCGSAGQISRYR